MWPSSLIFLWLVISRSFFKVSDYLTGLSGGSWAVSSLAMNDMPDLFSLVLGGNGQNGAFDKVYLVKAALTICSGWMLDLGLLAPEGILGVVNDARYCELLWVAFLWKATYVAGKTTFCSRMCARRLAQATRSA